LKRHNYNVAKRATPDKRNGKTHSTLLVLIPSGSCIFIKSTSTEMKRKRKYKKKIKIRRNK
jgi:hypothetical protein